MKKCVLTILLLGAGFAGLAGCGKVSKSPIDPVINPSVVFNFDTGLQGWALNGTAYPGWSVTPSTLFTFNDSPGSMRIDVVFNQGASNNKIAAQCALKAGANNLQDRVASVWVFWATGISGGDVRGQLYIQAPGKTVNNWNTGWANGVETTFQQGRWMQMTLDVDQPSYQDPTYFPDASYYTAAITNVTDVGVQLYTHNGVANNDPGVFFVDNFGY